MQRNAKNFDMADAVAQQQPQQPEQQQGFFGGFFGNALRSLFFVWLISNLLGFNKQTPTATQKDAATGKVVNVAHAPLWHPSQEFYLEAYLTPSAEFSHTSDFPMIWDEKHLFYNAAEFNIRNKYFSINETSYPDLFKVLL